MKKLIAVLRKDAITERGGKILIDRKLLAEQQEAMETLRKMGVDANAATPELIRLAQHDSILLSLPATQALGAIGTPEDEVTEALVSIVKGGKHRARFWALNALAAMEEKAKAAVPVYLSVMTDPNEGDTFRIMAIGALYSSRVDRGKYVPQHTSVILNANPDVAAQAALSLWGVEDLKSKLSTDTVVKMLLREAESGGYDYVSNLAWMVDPNGDVVPAELAEIARTQMAHQDKASKILASWDDDRNGLEEYRSLLKDPNAQVRAAAIRPLLTVGEFVSSELEMIILEIAVKDASEKVRKQARTVLRKVAPHGPKFVSALKKHLCSKKVERRLLVLPLLKANSGVLTSKNRVLLLIKTMADENPKVRAQAAEISGGYPDYGKQLLPALKRLVRDENKLVASEASSAIKRLSAKEP